MTRLAVQLFSTSLRGMQASTSCASTCMSLRLRRFATLRDGPFPSLNTATPGAPSSQPLAGSSSAAGSARQRDSIGPFPLGVPTGAGAGKPDKPWKQLTASGKVVRATARLSNVSVIALGAGLSALIIYALASDMFSPNSATVLQKQAIARLDGSTDMARHFRAPYRYHNTPPITERPRHRTSGVNSLAAVDSRGREHLLLTFYVEGAPEGAVPAEHPWYSWERISQLDVQVGEALSREGLQHGWDYAKYEATETWLAAQRIFQMLIGAPINNGNHTSGHRDSAHPVPPPKPQEATVSNGWGFAGLFSSLRRTGGSGNTRSSTAGWSSSEDVVDYAMQGEVHADFVRDANGRFVFRYLFIDVPSSRVRNPRRIFIERAADVQEGEQVLLWE